MDKVKVLKQTDVLDSLNKLFLDQKTKTKVITTVLGCVIYQVDERDMVKQ